MGAVGWGLGELGKRSLGDAESSAGRNMRTSALVGGSNACPLAGIARSLGGAGAFLLTGTYTMMKTGTLSAPIRS
jgi:hypothetical protein